MPPAQKSTREERQRAAERALEWRQFRVNYLFSQGNLAHALGCCRRTICAIESGREVMAPSYELLRRFRDLKKRQEKINGQPAAPAYANVSHLFAQRRA
jgi:DNA-binding XRE family transcriptional regulator